MHSFKEQHSQNLVYCPVFKFC